MSILSAAALTFAKTPAGQRLKQQAAQKAMEILDKAQRSLDQLGARARQRLGSRTSEVERSAPQNRGRSETSRRTTGSKSVRPGSKRRPARANQSTIALGKGTGRQKIESSLGTRASMTDTPPWQEKLKAKSAMGTKPIVNPGSHRGRAADR